MTDQGEEKPLPPPSLPPRRRLRKRTRRKSGCSIQMREHQTDATSTRRGESAQGCNKKSPHLRCAFVVKSPGERKSKSLASTPADQLPDVEEPQRDEHYPPVPVHLFVYMYAYKSEKPTWKKRGMIGERIFAERRRQCDRCECSAKSSRCKWRSERTNELHQRSVRKHRDIRLQAQESCAA